MREVPQHNPTIDYEHRAECRKFEFTLWDDEMIEWYKNWLKGQITPEALEKATLEQLREWWRELSK